MENVDTMTLPLEKFKCEIERRQKEIDELRLNGITKIENLRNENANIKKNKQLDKETKEKIITSNKDKILDAKEVKLHNSLALKEEVSELIKDIRTHYKKEIKNLRNENKPKIAELKKEFLTISKEENLRYQDVVKKETSIFNEKLAKLQEKLKIEIEEVKAINEKESLEFETLKLKHAEESKMILEEEQKRYLKEEEEIAALAEQDRTRKAEWKSKLASMNYEEKEEFLKTNKFVSLVAEYLKDHPHKKPRASRFDFEFTKAKTPGEIKELKIAHKNNMDDLRNAHNQIINDARVKCNSGIEELKDQVHALYVEEFSYIECANNRRLPIIDNFRQGIENYINSFNIRNFLLANGLYFAIIILIIAATIYYAIANNGMFLFDVDKILLIGMQVSPKMFLALGVAGLIVLAGTDLSIGRLVGLSAVLTGMLVTTTGETSVEFFGNPVSFAAIPLGLRVIFAFALSIIACCVVSGIAGFFTAKFKMHPFISTLATQLMTFGILAGVTGNSFTGSPDPVVSEVVSGFIPGTNFSVMIIYAIIGIAVMRFIWNKTKFGKNMFAVGGNPEAASVSGISVFWVTIAVFLLAGVYYGIGGSMLGIYTGNVRAQTGQGMEADAIAACVVGGVSFSGGVGKIRGVVIGATLFQVITVVLPLIGITDANYQLAIKGAIILAAVALDCAKYLRKK